MATTDCICGGWYDKVGINIHILVADIDKGTSIGVDYMLFCGHWNSNILIATQNIFHLVFY